MRSNHLPKLFRLLLIMALFATAGVAEAQVTAPTPDYFGTTPNWANSPQMRKFVDPMPGLYVSGVSPAPAPGTQFIPVAVPDTETYPGSDYYEIELGEFTQRMHSDLPPTKLRGYRQTNTADPNVSAFHYLGPLIIAQKDRPVRIKFTNRLPFGPADGTGRRPGDLFVPVDTTLEGSGPGPDGTYYTQNRAVLHLHGGRTPWVSDGTPHQWITPAGETTNHPIGVSMENVPDMPDPGPGSQTYYYTNQQSSRLLFYHDHAWGITRLNVYVGMAAGYVIRDAMEQALVSGGTVNGRTFAAGTIPADEIPLIIQDKGFVDAATVLTTDPTWIWGSTPGTPNTGDLWWPHVYMPAQNPYNPDASGVNPMGRWAFGPWFWPPTNDIANPPIPNPLYDCGVGGACTRPWQPPLMPATPNPSWVAEAFLDTPVVNGMAYPTITVQPKAYRFRILNAAHDRFFNLQMYRAVSKVGYTNPTVAPYNHAGAATDLTEVAMVPAALPAAGVCTAPGVPAGCFPEMWPADGREGGVPDPATAGPSFIQIGNEGGFLPAPVVIANQPVNWNADVTTFNAGNVLQLYQGGGALMLGPAERADVIVDFSQFAGQTLILYNDAPAPWPALDPHYDYYTGAPDRTDMGGVAGTLPGYGPNTRTIMQINVAAGAGAPFNLANLQAAFAFSGAQPGVFAGSQEAVVVGQTAYNPTYNMTFPALAPNWGAAQIYDENLSYMDTAGVLQSVTMKMKAIQDEQGETFDRYGRMSAKLGLMLPFGIATPTVQTFVLQNFVDPPTEIVNDGEVQIWKITHNGVDTHPVHFHLYDVQVINRVGWDGGIRLPDANELGWKETVRISPLEDTIVALRPIAPRTPFGIPDSIRPLNPALPLGTTEGFTTLDPFTGEGLVTPTVNVQFNFGQEYVWHCHILSHEEMDMMRPVVFNSARQAPSAPSSLSANAIGGASPSITLNWTDATPAANPATMGNPANEVGFRIERAVGAGAFAFRANAPANSTTWSDTGPSVAPETQYRYRVMAFNALGNSPASNIATATASASGLIAANDAFTGNANSSLVVAPPGILANDGAAATGSNLVVRPANGTINHVGDGGFSYMPNPNFTGVDTFTYRASNAVALSNVATVTLTINPGPTMLASANDAYSVTAGQSLTVPPPGILANDGAAATGSNIVARPANGTLVHIGDGGFTYTPNAGFTGVDTFTYRASNATTLSAVNTVTITVNPIPPLSVANDNYTMSTGGILNIAAPGILANDDPLATGSNIVARTQNGELIHTGDGSFNYTPGPGFVGVDWFTYRASNATSMSAVGFVQILVSDVPALAAAADFYTVNAGMSTTIPAPGLLANDDPSATGSNLVVRPTNGTIVTHVGDGGFTYLPNAGFTGTDTFTYRASNATGLSAVTTVTITVQ